MLASFGLQWKPSSIEVLTTARHTHGPVHVQIEGAPMEIPYVQSMVVLGSLIAKSSMEIVEHRLGKTLSAFWALAVPSDVLKFLPGSVLLLFMPEFTALLCTMPPPGFRPTGFSDGLFALKTICFGG